MNEFVVLGIVLLLVATFIRGAIIVFSKNFWLALALFFLILPLFVLWAFVEGFFNWSD
jgi:hypothetical protein